MNRRAWLLVTLSVALGPLLAGEFPHRARVVEIEDLTHDTKRVRFRLVDGGFQFTPGQYLFLKVPDAFVARWNERYGTSHKEIVRPYSFASSSSRLPEFDLMIKLAAAPADKVVPPGVASSFIHTALKRGDEVSFAGPAGNLYLRKEKDGPVIIVASGTGAAPFVSLLEYWFERGFERDNQIYFFFGVRAKRDLFLDQRFRDWQKQGKIHYFPALSNPAPRDGWQGETGLIQSVVEKHFPGAAGADAYLAGSPAMLRETMKVLLAKGIARQRIHFDEIAVR